jgi:hypothetical protein
MPESRAEILNGRLIHAAPADEPHATTHADLDCLLRLHAAAGYRSATDMLTRTSRNNDFAPDASIYPAPDGGPRKLDELAFEVTSKQRLSIPTEKARELARRGVRRVFAILVQQHRVLEWDRTTDNWRPLPADSAIEDPCLVRPLAVRALVDAAAVEDEAARAVLAKKSPVIAAALAESEAAAEARGETRGLARGLREAVRVAAEVLGVCIDREREAAIDAMEVEGLKRLLAHLGAKRAWPPLP